MKRGPLWARGPINLMRYLDLRMQVCLSNQNSEIVLRCCTVSAQFATDQFVGVQNVQNLYHTCYGEFMRRARCVFALLHLHWISIYTSIKWRNIRMCQNSVRLVIGRFVRLSDLTSNTQICRILIKDSYCKNADPQHCVLQIKNMYRLTFVWRVYCEFWFLFVYTTIFIWYVINASKRFNSDCLQ